MSGYQGNIIIKNPATPTGPAQNGSAPGVWTLSEALAFKRQGVWPTQGLIPGDPYFNYVSMLLSTTSLGNANNNLFVDSSGAFIPLSRFGNTTQGSMTPYGANWSNYFDGSGDNLYFAGNAAFSIPTSTTPFTIEAWVYLTGNGGCIFSEQWTGSGTIPICLSLNSVNSLDDTNGRYLTFVAYNGAWNGGAKANAEIPLNTWTHIACVFTGSTTKIYYNGVDVTRTSSPTPGTTWPVTGQPGDGWYVAQRWDTVGTPYMSGYISNLRFVNGTAVYTSAFTPPTAPLTAISGTVLLTCQSNRFRDASSNNFTPTRNGDVRVTDFSPFLSSTLSGISYDQSDITNWSGYFDGSGDYLVTPSNSALTVGTGDFTLECWINTTAPNNSPVMDSRSTDGGADGFTIKAIGATSFQILTYANVLSASVPNYAGQWTHLAMVRASGTSTFYVNGVSYGTGYLGDLTNNNVVIGGGRYGGSASITSSFPGSISNFRIVKGTAIYTGNFTPPAAPLTAVSGTQLLTCQSAAFTDNSTNNFIITPFGNTTVTGNSPFNTVGYWSNYFTASDYLQIAGPATGTGTWTVEGWFYFTSFPGGPIFAQGTADNTASWFLYLTSSGGLNFYSNGNISASAGGVVTANTWVHIALVSNASNSTTYVNGTSVATGSYAGKTFNGSPFQINRGYGGATSGNPGYQSNVRMVVGTAVYTSNFTPPTSPLTAISGTSLLTCQNGRFIDNSTNAYAVTATGSPSVQSFDPFYTATIASNGGSMYFDGNGDYLTLPAGEAFQFGTGDFTVEMWVYPLNALSTDYFYIDARNSGQTNTWCLYRTSANALSWFNGSGEYTGGNVLTNQWSHLAYSRSGSSGRLFINGVLQTTATDNTNYSVAPTISYIGGRFSQQQYFSGYMNGLRVTKSALYTAAFTPPTAPLTPSANTRLLTNGMNAGIYDATAINDMETVGNSQVRFPTPFAPANYWAGSFDGSGDYLSVPYATANFDWWTSDFTVEAWVFPSSLTGWQDGAGLPTMVGNTSPTTVTNYWSFGPISNGTVRFFYFNGSTNNVTSSATLAANTWSHIAMTKTSSGITIFVNGVASTTTAIVGTPQSSTGTSLVVGAYNGAYVNGSVSNLRIVKGAAVYSGNFTPPTTPLTAISGTSLLTCQNKTFIDNSANAFTITANGNATAGAIGPFTATGGTSMYFDGTGDYLTSNAANDLYAFGTGSFTIEMWFNLSSLANLQVLYDSRPSGTDGLYPCIFVPAGGASVNLQVSGATQITGTATLSTGVWYHLALSRSSGSTKMFLNGTQVGSTYADTNAYLNSGTTRPFIGGSSYSAGTLTVNGYIDDLRVTKGVARYTFNFTPPTQPFVTY